MRQWAMAVVLVLASAPAFADHIGIYDDTFGGPCFGPPPPLGLVTMYILHESSAGSLGGRWNVINNSDMLVVSSQCAGGLSIPIIPTDGLIASYGGCTASPITACQVTFFNLGTPFQGCNHLVVKPFLGDSQVQVLDCADQFQNATAGYFSFDLSGACDTCVLATEQTTWGSVKALYR